jgi:hypothetical protein
VPASVSKTCLVRFDNNKCSVAASAVGRPVEVQAYADRIAIRQDGRVVGDVKPICRTCTSTFLSLAPNFKSAIGARARIKPSAGPLFDDDAIIELQLTDLGVRCFYVNAPELNASSSIRRYARLWCDIVGPSSHAVRASGGISTSGSYSRKLVTA